MAVLVRRIAFRRLGLVTLVALLLSNEYAHSFSVNNGVSRTHLGQFSRTDASRIVRGGSSSAWWPFSRDSRIRYDCSVLYTKPPKDSSFEKVDYRQTSSSFEKANFRNVSTAFFDVEEPEVVSPADESAVSPPVVETTVVEKEPKKVSSWFGKDFLIMGMEPTPELIAIVTIYFVEGALGLARLAQTYLLKDELSLGPAELSALTGIFVLPWTIKPLYGFLSDGFPLFGYQRKSYLIAAGIIGGLSYGFLGLSGLWDSLETGVAVTGTVAALLLSSACVAMSDVVADGIVVTKTREAKDPAIAGGLQSLCWGTAAAGALLSAYFSGSLLEVMSVRDVFTITAILPFLVALIALQMDEEPVVKSESDTSPIEIAQEQLKSVLDAFKQPSIWRPVAFMFLWQATPTSDGAFFFFLSNDLGLGPEFMGRVRLVTSAATLVGVWLYNQYFKTTRIKDILFWSTVASFPLGMLPVLLITHANRALGIPDQALIYGDDVALAALGEISFLPTLVLAARLCPPGIEAIFFATLMSIKNGSSTLGTEIGALLTKLVGVTESNFDNLAFLTTFCNITSLLPLFLIGWLDKVGDISEEELDKMKKEDAIDTEAK